MAKKSYRGAKPKERRDAGKVYKPRPLPNQQEQRDARSARYLQFLAARARRAARQNGE